MSTKLIAGALAAVMATSMLALPAQAKKGGGKHWHGHGHHHHHHFRYRFAGPACAEWAFVRRHGEKKWYCVAWY